MKVEFSHEKQLYTHEWIKHLEEAVPGIRDHMIPVVRVEELRNLVDTWRAQKNPKESLAFRLAMKELEHTLYKEPA